MAEYGTEQAKILREEAEKLQKEGQLRRGRKQAGKRKQEAQKTQGPLSSKANYYRDLVSQEEIPLSQVPIRIRNELKAKGRIPKPQTYNPSDLKDIGEPAMQAGIKGKAKESPHQEIPDWLKQNT